FEAGTDIRAVQSDLKVLTSWLADDKQNPEIASHVLYIGSGGPRFFLALAPLDPDPHRAFVLINTRTPDDVAGLVPRVNAFMDANLPGARSDAKKMWFGGTEPGVVEVRLSGPDGEVLASAASKVEQAFASVPGTLGIKHDWDNRVMKFIVDVNQVRARRAGITSTDIANALSSTFSGTRISDYREGDRILPIELRGTDDIRNSLAGLQRVGVLSSATGEFVSLQQIAKVQATWQFGRIVRRDQQRTLTVQARNPEISAGDLLARIRPTLDQLDLPAGYAFKIGGEVEDQGEANSGLFATLPISLAGIAILLIGQFNSFRKGGLIILTIPLIMIGGIAGLFIMQANYSFMVLLGFFSLAGILINNGIVLIDRIQTEEATGKAPLDAIIDACMARFRPILMTTFTTVLGLVPLILFGGALFYGMACVIAFGLIVATFLTLGFVPAVYSLLYRVPTKPVRLIEPVPEGEPAG
ncbi:MAG: efflux RND transporter permease subunit, partial [Aestuariivirgaceae bacterium]